MSQIFGSIRGRSLIGLLAFSFILPIIAIAALWPGWLDAEHDIPLAGAIDLVASYSLLLVLLLYAVYRKTGDYRFPLGPNPSYNGALVYASLAVPLIGVALVGIYAVFLPLSYVWPEEVHFWVIEPSPMIFWERETGAAVASLLNILMLVVAGPIIEEIFFRGFLLNRWMKKYGARKAIAFSSIAFAVLHVDLIGAAIFSVVLCMIYLRTQSLIGPIIVHVANNCLGLLAEVIESYVYSKENPYSLADFQSDWWLAIVGAAIGIPWLIWYWKKHLAGVVLSHSRR